VNEGWVKVRMVEEGVVEFAVRGGKDYGVSAK
jgi:hypothetical protein